MAGPQLSISDVQPSAALPIGAGLATHILDAAPLGMLVAGMDGQVLYSNRAFSDMMGYVPAAEGPMRLADLVHADDNTAFCLQFERISRDEARSWRGEHRFRHADGSPLWVMVAATLLLGGPDLVVIQLTNIELQKKAEEALAYSESRWHSALESARQGVWDYDMRKDRMFYSHMWRVLRGIPPDEEIGKGHDAHWLERIHPDDRERIAATAKKQGQGAEGFDTLEYRERTRDGRYIWILSRGKPIEWDENGTVLRAVGTDTDITHLKTVEMELAAEKERLRVTLEAMADGVIATDTQGHIVFINPVAERLLGCKADEVRGQQSKDIFVLRHAETDETQLCPGRLCIEQRRVVEAGEDLVLWNRGGGWRDIRCTAAPVIMPDGTISGSVLVFQDVTQSRALQRQLAHSATHDALTGLTNRAAFEQSLDRVIRASRGNGSESSLIYVDLDYFKPVNDSAGHAAGDALLKQVAQTIRESCRAHDMVARIGGDEFAVILENCPSQGGRQVADKIVRAINALIFTWAGKEYRIGASAGLAVISSEPASPLGFMGEADAACYAAKAEGRGRVVAFQDMINPPTRNRR